MAAGRGRKGFSGQIISALMLCVVVGFCLAFFRVNNIHSSEELISYLRTMTKKADGCSDSVANGGKCKGPKLPERGSAGSGGITLPDGRRIDPSKLPPGDWRIDPPAGKNEVNIKAPGGTTLPGSQEAAKVPSTVYQAALQKVKVLDSSKGPKVKYKRSEWRHWIGSPCDAREKALIKQGKNVKTANAKTCKVLSGTWVDPYGKDSNGNGGDTFTDPKRLDIDHIAPLGYVAKHGGQEWPVTKKQQYANDPSVLLVTSAKENRSKSDKGPSEYMPPKEENHCMYARAWVTAASKYGFAIEPKDKDVLQQALGTCKS